MTDATHNRIIKAILWAAILLLGIIAATHLGRSAIKGDETTAMIMAVGIFIVAAVFKLGLQKKDIPLNRRYLPWIAVPAILLAIWAANTRLFGKFDVGSVIFHLQHGLAYDGVGDDIAEFLIFLTIAAILIACVSYLARRDYRVKWVDRLIALPLLLVNPLSLHIYDTTFRPSSDIALDALYTAPSIENTSPEKNLLIIYLESTEATFENEAFGDSYKGFTELGETGLRVHGITQVEGTGWTIAGLVASQCGIPLFNYGLIRKNHMEKLDSFLPNAKCLGSLLEDRGYQTSYLGGAELSFSGKDRFLKTHGYQTRMGVDEVPEADRGPLSDWGIYDDQLFTLAFQELKRLEDADAPYAFSILTLDPHSPLGYPSPSCFDTIKGADQMDTTLLSIKCSARLTKEFLSKARDNGFLDNTTVILMSDHLAHVSVESPELDALEGLPRSNYLVILDPDLPPGDLEVTGSMMDMYPTILEIIGLPPAQGKAGLGVSLLGHSDTLLKQHGLTELNHAIKSDTVLRKQLWALD